MPDNHFNAVISQKIEVAPGLIVLRVAPEASGRVTELWRTGVLESAWGLRPTPENTRIFLCGNPHMIDDVSVLLAAEGFREHSRKEAGEVFVERYW